jgi:hypothetical protein
MTRADAIVSSHPSCDAINRARQIIRDVVPSAVESVKWNAPSFSTGEHFATFFLGGKKRVPEFQDDDDVEAKESAFRETVREWAALSHEVTD